MSDHALNTSRVRREDGGLALVHHLTGEWEFDAAHLAPFTHFGTRRAGRARVFDWPEKRQISGFLAIDNPLELPDPGRSHDLSTWLDLISASAAGDILDADIYARIEAHEQETGEGLEMLAQALRDAGWDGIRYINACEDAGSTSWVILDPAQLLLVSDDLAAENRDPWELSLDEFIGPDMIGEMFEIDGHDEPYEHLWEEMICNAETLPLLARSPEGYEARWLSDWEPAATLGLFAPDGSACGFYMGAQLWIDGGHRGQGLSRLLVAAAADLLGGSPTQNEEGLGFSEAGYWAHKAAWESIQAAARRAEHLREDITFEM